MFLQLAANGLVLGSILAIAAVGVSLIYGILGLVNFAYGDVMTFGAFVAVLFNVTFGLEMAVAALLAMIVTAVLSRRAGRRPVAAAAGAPRRLHEPLPRLDRPRAGSPAGDLPGRGPAAALVRRGPVQGLRPRLRPALGKPGGGDRRRNRRRSSSSGCCSPARRWAARCAPSPTIARWQPSRASIPRRVVALTWVLAGLLAGLAGVLAALVQSSFDPNFGFTLLLPVFAAVVLGGIGSAYGALLGGLVLGLATELSTWPGFEGGVDPVYKPVVAFVVLIGVLLVRPAGPARQGADAVSTIASGEFWAFVGVVAGIYTLLGLGIQLEFGFAGLLNFGHVAFMAIGAYTMAILVVKEDWSTWLAAPFAVLAAAAAGVLVGLPTLRLRADYFAIATIAFSRDRPLCRDQRGPAHRRIAGHDQPGRRGTGRVLQRPVGALPELAAGRAAPRLQGRDDARDRLGRRACLLRGAVGCRPDALGPRASLDPGGRGRGRIAREERVCLQVAGARAGVRRSPALAGCFYAWQFSFFSPRRLRAAADVLRVDDRHPRRAWGASSRCRSARSCSACSSPAPASSTSRRLRGSTPPSAPTCGCW